MSLLLGSYAGLILNISNSITLIEDKPGLTEAPLDTSHMESFPSAPLGFRPKPSGAMAFSETTLHRSIYEWLFCSSLPSTQVVLWNHFELFQLKLESGLGLLTGCN